MRSFTIIAMCFALLGCGRGVLPSERTMVSTSEQALHSLVLGYTPIGTSQADVEKVLAGSFHRQWRVINYESRELVSKRGFSVPVGGGDYYLTSDLAVVRRGVWSSDVVTIYFLFGPSHQLKDIAVEKWTDSI